MRHWSAVVLAALVGVVTQTEAGTLALDQPGFIVKVTGYDQGVQYTARYGLDPARTTVHLLSRVKGDPPPATDHFAAILRELEAREGARQRAVAGLKLTLPQRAKWVSPSPDGRYLLVGFEDPRLDVMRSIAVIDASTRQVLRAVELKGRSFISDCEWSADSRILALLEGNERYSKAPGDLVRLIFGKPVPLITVSVSLLNVDSGSMTRALIAGDVRFATSVVTRVSQE